MCIWIEFIWEKFFRIKYYLFPYKYLQELKKNALSNIPCFNYFLEIMGIA